MKVTLYTKDNCSYCQKAKALLTVKGIEYMEINIGNDITREEFFELFPEARTVPQIIVDEKHIGGYDELAKFL